MNTPVYNGAPLSVSIVPCGDGYAFVCITQGERCAVLQPDDLRQRPPGAQTGYTIIAAGVISMRQVFLFRNNLDHVLGRVRKLPENYLLLLPEYIPPPSAGVRFDGCVESFICSLPVFQQIDRIDGTSCFRLLMTCLNGETVNMRLAVLQMGKIPPPTDVAGFKCPEVSVVIPCNGDLAELTTCLQAVKQQSVQVTRVNICLDKEADERALHAFTGDPLFSCWYNDPLHAGPYFPRDHVIRNTTSPLVMFQDADDISTCDRVETMLREMERFPACGMMGCHELRVDEEEETVKAIRFPEDVSASLAQTPVHSLYHPTAIIRRQAYLASGGFTRWRKFASDYQFLLKAFFFMSIRNVDEFLYIRKKRSNSLTTHALTGLHSRTRKFFDSSWIENFEKVKAGKCAVEASTLWEDDRHIPFRLNKIPAENHQHGI